MSSMHMLFNFKIESMFLQKSDGNLSPQSVHALSANAWATLDRRSMSRNRPVSSRLNNRVAPENVTPGPKPAESPNAISALDTRSAEMEDPHNTYRRTVQVRRPRPSMIARGGRSQRIPS